MQEVSKKDFSEVQRLLRYFISRSRTTDTSLKGVNARRRAGLVLKKWSKNDKKRRNELLLRQATKWVVRKI